MAFGGLDRYRNQRKAAEKGKEQFVRKNQIRLDLVLVWRMSGLARDTSKPDLSRGTKLSGTNRDTTIVGFIFLVHLTTGGLITIPPPILCVFIQLHITAQSGPIILPSHSMPLALILPRGDQ